MHLDNQEMNSFTREVCKDIERLHVRCVQQKFKDVVSRKYKKNVEEFEIE